MGIFTRSTGSAAVSGGKARAVVSAKPNGAALLAWGAIIGLLFAMYADVLTDLFQDWWMDPDYSHGFLVVPVAIYAFWTGRMPTQPCSDRRGLILIAIGCLFYVAGTLGAEFFLTRFSFVVLLAGLAWTMFGVRQLRRAGLPLLLLAAVIPLPTIVYNYLAIPLQLLASNVSVWLLDLVGVAALQHGNIIELANMQIGVAEACSGLRSMSSLTVLALLLAHFQGYGPRSTALIAILAIPIAIVVNLSRVAGTALLVEFWDKDLALGFYHSFTGWLVFLGGVGLLLVVSGLVGWLTKADEGDLRRP